MNMKRWIRMLLGYVVFGVAISSLSQAREKVVLENDSMRAVFNKGRNYTLCGIQYKTKAGENRASLLKTLEPTFHYGDPDLGVYWAHMGGECTEFGKNVNGRGFKILEHDLSDNTLTVKVKDYYMLIEQRCVLLDDMAGLEIEYRYEALRDVQQSSWTTIPKVSFNSCTYERFFPSYHVQKGEIQQIVRYQDGSFSGRLNMKGWFGIRDSETKDGLLLFFPPLQGSSFLQRGGSYFLISGPFTSDQFIPKGEIFTQKLYVVPFHGNHDAVLEAWCARLGINLNKPFRPVLSPTGSRLAETDDYVVWHEIPTWQILEEEKPPLRRSSAIRLSAAKDEYEPFQLVVRGLEKMPYTRMECMRLVFSDLKQENGNTVIPGENFKYCCVEYIDLRKPVVFGWSGRSPDTLVEKESFLCRPDKNTVLWVTLKVPSEVSAGDYTGTIQIVHGIFPTRKKTVTAIPVRLHVFGFTMPEQRHLAVHHASLSRHGVRLAYKGKDTNLIYKRYRENTLNHRCGFRYVSTPITFEEGKAEIKKISLPSFEAVLKEHFEILKMPVVIGRTFDIGSGHKLKDTYFGKVSEILTPLWRARYRKVAEVMRDFLMERGWQDRVIFELYDEPYNKDIPYLVECTKILKKVFPEIKLTYASMGYDPRLYGLMDAWMGSGYAHIPAQRRKEAGDAIWLGNNKFGSIDCLAAQRRLRWWRIWLDKIDGVVNWSIANWVDWKGTGQWGKNRISAWIYPGENGPIDTIRWELTREGLEDYEYLWLLEQAVKRAKAEMPAGKNAGAVAEGERLLNRVNELVIRKGRFLDYNPDPLLLHEIREAIGKQIEKMSRFIPKEDPQN